MNLVIVLGVIITLVSGAPVLLQLMRNHPKGLIILFMTEMWERFSYYGMRGLLIFYLTQHFLFDDVAANAHYSSYTSLVYLMPVVGGLIADRFLGTRKAVAFGALLLVAGHFLMAVEGGPAKQAVVWQGHSYAVQVAGRGEGAQSKLVVDGHAYAIGPAKDGGLKIEGLPAAAPLPQVLPKGSYKLDTHRDQGILSVFYLALSLIIMGVGFLKGNASSTVGMLYQQHDPRRDPAFTLYYYGINLGSFWAASICGLIGVSVGWWAGFGLAGLGMLAGWVVFVLGKPLLQGQGEPPDPEALRTPVVGPLKREGLIYLLSLLGVGLVWLVIRNVAIVQLVFAALAGGVLLFVFWFAVTKCSRVERERLMLACVLVAGATVFWALYEQAGNSMNLFAERNTDLHITRAAELFTLFGQQFAFGSADQIAAIGFTPAHWWNWIDTGMTASQTQNFQPGFLLILAPVFAAMWGWLARRNRDPDPTMKFALGLLQVGASFLIMVFGAKFVDASFRMPLMFLALAYFVQETGELCLSPVGLSEITKLAPPMIVSTLMAVFFLSNSGGQLLAGWIAAQAGTQTVGGQVVDPKAALDSAIHVYGAIGWGAIGVGALFVVLSFLIKGWAHGADDTAG
jgi:POT family proton-dependent oligopeptide transporter